MGRYATSRNVTGSIPGSHWALFNFPNPSSRTMALGLTQGFFGGEVRLVSKTDNLTSICDQIV
jgi:hypothetical protein